MKGEGWSWNQVEFKFSNLVPVLKWGCLKIRCLPVWSQDTEWRQRRQGTSLQLLENHLACHAHTALPTWPCQMEGCWRRAGDGGNAACSWPLFPLEGGPATRTYPTQRMVEPCAPPLHGTAAYWHRVRRNSYGTVLQQPQLAVTGLAS